MTDDQKSACRKLHDEDGLSYNAISKRLSLPLTAVWKVFNAKPPKPPPPPKPNTSFTTLLPPHKFPSSVPMHRRIDHNARNLPQMSKPELERDLRRAVLNTGRRRR
jgi:hypothetical protein